MEEKRRTGRGPAAGIDHASNPLADRRLAYARGAAEDGAWREAADMFEQTLELAPDWVPAWIGLGEARGAYGDAAGAAAAFRAAVERDPADRYGAALRLGALDPAARPRTASSAYVAALFDAYADRFDAHLLQGLAYRSPADLAGALASLGRRRFDHVLDLGCGTGLGGAALRAATTTLTGVDLSPGMIDIARAKAIYDRLAVGDIRAFLDGEPAASADLVLAADVFVYIGDLAPVFAASARVLKAAGALAFTVQRGSDADDATYAIGRDMRFAHGRAYLAAALDAAGFGMLVQREHAARREKGRDVSGLLVVASRR